MLDLRITSLEDLLIKLYNTFTKEVWKSKTRGLKKRAAGPLAWKMVHASLQARAEKAIRLMSWALLFVFSVTTTPDAGRWGELSRSWSCNVYTLSYIQVHIKFYYLLFPSPARYVSEDIFQSSSRRRHRHITFHCINLWARWAMQFTSVMHCRALPWF